MAGDKNGKGKMVVQKKKKRTREDREREHAEAVANAADRHGSFRIRDPQVEGEPRSAAPLRRLGRTRQPEIVQTTPQSRSGPWTQGGGAHRTAGHVQQQTGRNSDTEVEAQHSSESEPPQVELLDLRGIPGPRIKRLRYVAPEIWFP